MFFYKESCQRNPYWIKNVKHHGAAVRLGAQVSVIGCLRTFLSRL